MPQPTVCPKIIFFDVDDTLYIKDEQRIADSTRYALQQLKQKGIITAIATGRSPTVLPSAIWQLMHDTGIEMLVSINGQYVRYQGQTLAHFPMDRQMVQQIGAYCAQHGIAYAAVSANQISVSHETQALRQALNDLGIDYTLFEHTTVPSMIYQMLAFYPTQHDELMKQGLPAGVKVVRWHTQGVDILDQAGSKARGIAVALKQLGLTMHEAMAFGDGLNDMEMMQAVGFGVAMGNAHPALQAVARYVAPSIIDDGLYWALVDLGIIQPQ